MIKKQLEDSLKNIQSAKKLVDEKREEESNDFLENYHYELLDIELRLKDMLNYCDNL